jgi:hypothetical protein
MVAGPRAPPALSVTIYPDLDFSSFQDQLWEGGFLMSTLLAPEAF